LAVAVQVYEDETAMVYNFNEEIGLGEYGRSSMTVYRLWNIMIRVVSGVEQSL
jgi:hypothetical protein